MGFDLSTTAAEALDEAGVMLVLGGPGSGKTTLSLLKAQRLIKDLEPGQRILFLSFSRAAVRQVLARTKDILSRSDREQVVVKTYHSFCVDILRSHGRLLTGKQPRLYFPGTERVDRAAFDGDWQEERARLAREEALYAFDLFASSCAELLGRCRAVHELVTAMYPIIILDEFQDTNDSQWALVQRLSEGSRLIVLADQEQRIFEYDSRIDPRRLELLREFISPAEFDLGGTNHRSPDAGILQFADAVLHNSTLPTTEEVKELAYSPAAFESTVHAATVWTFSRLRGAGVEDPTVAVLCRANTFVADISNVLTQPHRFGGRDLPPLDHDVVWDEDLAAVAAQVVASIMEWPTRTPQEGAIQSLDAIARYFEMKNAIRPSATSQRKVESYRAAAAACVEARAPRTNAARAVVAAASSGIAQTGDPKVDWLRARDVLTGINDLVEIHTNVRFVRLFRASDEIGRRLSDRWAADGAYTNAIDAVRRALEIGRVLSDQRDHRGCTLMTMHKCKGKEFDGVVLVEGLYRGRFFDERREAPPYSATRRLLRVAITRARHLAVIVRPQRSLPLGG
jgi:DNA helicase-2/ATP-dependent DNA helicase PcrA